MNVLKTERLQLRHLRAPDITALAPLYGNPNVMHFYNDGLTLSRNQTQGIIDYYSKFGKKNKSGIWAVLNRESGRFLGVGGIVTTQTGFKLRRQWEVSYMLAPEQWGQGLATELLAGLVDYGFAVLRAQTLLALIHPNNAASIRVAVKNGFTPKEETTTARGPRVVYVLENPDENGRLPYFWQRE